MTSSTPKFAAMIAGLCNCGMPMSQIAREIGISRQQVHKIRSGQSNTPLYSTGARLVELHQVVTKGAKPPSR